jgi:hypothetical protein
LALLLDGSWCEVDDLEAYDGSATSVAAEEGIDLAMKMSLSEAWIRDRVDAFLQWEAGTTMQILTSLTAQNAVVDERLKRWHLANVLSMLYKDASFSQVNDRFEKKWKAFERDADQSKTEYFMAGVPYVSSPVRKPDAPAVIVTVGVQPAAAYSTAITRVDGAGRESAPSEPTVVQAAAGNGFTVSANGLAESDRWNVYATDGDGPMRKQNDSALNASATWSLPESGLSMGAQAGTGQTPDGRVRQRRILPRG